MILKHVPNQWKRDPEIVLKAARKNNAALEFASGNLKRDSEFMSKVDRELGATVAAEYASESLKGDSEFMLELVKTDQHSLEYASESLKGDSKFMLELVRTDKLLLEYASRDLKSDHDFMVEVSKIYGYDDFVIDYASQSLKESELFVNDARMGALAEPSGSVEGDLAAVRAHQREQNAAAGIMAKAGEAHNLAETTEAARGESGKNRQSQTKGVKDPIHPFSI